MARSLDNTKKIETTTKINESQQTTESLDNQTDNQISIEDIAKNITEVETIEAEIKSIKTPTKSDTKTEKSETKIEIKTTETPVYSDKKCFRCGQKKILNGICQNCGEKYDNLKNKTE